MMYRSIVSLVFGLVVLLNQNAVAKDEITITDLAGREVTLHAPIDRMILGEGRFVPNIAILDRGNPVERIVGMMGEFKVYDPATYAQYAAKFPEIETIPAIGRDGAQSFSLEKAITAGPDVAIFGLGGAHGPGAKDKQIIERLEAAGVPVIFVDFRNDPLVNTPKSLSLLGKVMGREAEAAEFNEFYRVELGKVQTALDGLRDKPSVFMELHVGSSKTCCRAMGNVMMGKFIEWAGGVNHVGDKVPGTFAEINLEHLLSDQPDYYIGTAIGSAAKPDPSSGRITLGANADYGLASASFHHASKRTGIAQLDAIQEKRAFSLWHHFYNTPMNVAAVQAMAKWLHPDRLQDVDPRKTLETYFERFQPVDLNGTYWITLEDKAPS